MSNNPLFIWFWIAAVFAFIALVVGTLRRMSQSRAARERSEREAALQAGIEAGHLLPDGKPACIVCGTAEATHALPDVGLSWFERMNPLRSLYGSVHLYRRIEDKFGEARLCAADLVLYEALVDDQLAEIRRDSARFSADVDRRISRLRGGEAVLAAQVERDRSIKSIRATYARPSVPQLSAVTTEHEEVAVSKQTTNGKPVDEHPEMTN